MRGRKRTPTPILRLRGSRRTETRKNEAVLPVGLPDVPDFIANDPIALREWDRVTAQLLEAGTLAKIHGTAIAVYCATVSRFAAAKDVLDSNGLTFDTENGPRKRPEISIVDTCSALIRQYAAEFCFTPSSQSKASKPSADKPQFPARMKPA